MSPSAGFCAIWQTDKIHDLLLSFTNQEDQRALRLVCKPFAEDIAPLLFDEITIKFNTHTFSRQARINALKRIGHHVRHVNFSMPHSSDTFLPPLLDPETGEEQTFVYSPEVEINDRGQVRSSISKFGDWEIAELLIHQYPPIFHSATNISGFVRAFIDMSNMESLTISCPHQASEQRYRRSAVDYALISLRMAIEHVCPPRLRNLNLTPIHSSSVFYLRAFTSLAISPRSTRVWRRIKSLTIKIDSHASCPDVPIDLYKILHTYLSTFTSLENLRFTWLGTAGPMPLSLHSEPSLFTPTPPPRPITPPCSPPGAYPTSPTDSPSSSPNLSYPPPLFSRHPHNHQTPRKASIRPLEFPHLQTFHLTNSLVDAANQIASFINIHRRTLREFSFHDTNLLKGSWDDALAPLTKLSGNDNWKREKERCWSWQPDRSQHPATTANTSSPSRSPPHKSTTSSTPSSPRPDTNTLNNRNSNEEDDNSNSLEVPFLLSTAALLIPSEGLTPTCTNASTSTSTTMTSSTTIPPPSSSSSSSSHRPINPGTLPRKPATATKLQKPLPLPPALPNELIEGPLWDTLLTNTLSLGYVQCPPGGAGKRSRVLVALGRALGRVLVGGCGGGGGGGGDGGGGGKKKNRAEEEEKDEDEDDDGGGEEGETKKLKTRRRRKKKNGRRRQAKKRVEIKEERSRAGDQDEWEEWWMGNWDGLVVEDDDECQGQTRAHEAHDLV